MTGHDIFQGDCHACASPWRTADPEPRDRYQESDRDMHWITENKEWLFSGIAVAVPLAVIGWFLARAKRNAKRESEKRIEQTQKSGSGSINIQAGGDINVDNRREDRHE